MAILIEKKRVVVLDGDDESPPTFETKLAILPSGKVLIAEGWEETKMDMEGMIKHFGSVEDAMPAIDHYYQGAIFQGRDYWLIEDPQEIRQLIQEAGLKEAGQKEVGSSADIARMLEEEGLK